jgi:stearoyl-CoA desaturase (delta-9 desaturase)
MVTPTLRIRGYIFIFQHLGCLGLVWTGLSPATAALVAVLFVLFEFGTTVGYHRYFCHRAFRTGRLAQFLLACLAMASNGGGVLHWIQNHERHHRFADTAEDLHSPVLKGIWWAYFGWQMKPDPPPCTPPSRHFSSFRELAMLEGCPWACTMAMALATAMFGRLTAIGAGPALVAFCLASVLNTHAAFLLIVWGHRWGRRRFASRDNSRNSFPLALLTLGEGWHNNHHRFPGSARFGWAWWEIDLGYGILRALAWLGVVWDLRGRPAIK